MTAPREEVVNAWALWDAGERMTEKQMAMLQTDAEGNRVIPKSAAEKRDDDFLAKYGETSVKWKHIHNFGEEVGKTIKAQIAPMRRRIEALEAEVRAGHERIKQLEAEARAGHEGIEQMEAGNADG